MIEASGITIEQAEKIDFFAYGSNVSINVTLNRIEWLIQTGIIPVEKTITNDHPIYELIYCLEGAVRCLDELAEPTDGFLADEELKYRKRISIQNKARIQAIYELLKPMTVNSTPEGVSI